MASFLTRHYVWTQGESNFLPLRSFMFYQIHTWHRINFGVILNTIKHIDILIHIYGGLNKCGFIQAVQKIWCVFPCAPVACVIRCAANIRERPVIILSNNILWDCESRRKPAFSFVSKFNRLTGKTGGCFCRFRPNVRVFFCKGSLHLFYKELM